MSDVFDKDKRSEIMRAVKSRNTKSTEQRLLSLFKQYHISGWKRGYEVKGHPDFVFLKKRIAVFVDGCFWHGHDCRNTRPHEHSDYWNAKRERNMRHDKYITERFQKRGWEVIRIWECELKKKNESNLIQRLGIKLDLKNLIL
jgi:DNA mismatch endonuclease (patch repair protein)